MSSFNSLLQKYVNMSYSELLDLARFSLSQFAGEMSNAIGADNTSKLCAVITAACLGVDGKLSPLEHKFFNELLNSNDSFDSNLDFVRSLGGEEAHDLVDTLVDSMPADQKAAVISFCLCFLAVDETITRDEVAFIDRLMA